MARKFQCSGEIDSVEGIATWKVGAEARGPPVSQLYFRKLSPDPDFSCHFFFISVDSYVKKRNSQFHYIVEIKYRNSAPVTSQ